MRNKSQAFVFTIWILVILTVLVVGVGHRVSMGLRISRYQREKLKAYCLARGGIQKAIVELGKDKNQYDALDESWASGKDALTGEALFENIEIEKGLGELFTVGIIDEERKININTASPELLVSLLEEFGLEEPDATEIARYIRVWRGDKEPELGLEEFSNRNFKRNPLTVAEELILVLEYFYQDEGIEDYPKEARRVFNEIKDFISVCADEKINVNTASLRTLYILADSLAENDQQKNSVKKVADAVIQAREEQDNKAFKSVDDIKIDVSAGTPDESLFASLKPALSVQSSAFRVESTGNAGKINKSVAIVYNRRDKKIAYWHEGL